MASTNTDFHYQNLGDNEEHKNQTKLKQASIRKRNSWMIIFTLIGIIVLGALIGIVYHLAINSNNTNTTTNSSKNEITTDLVLPNTTLNITTISDSLSEGKITYYQSESLPNAVTFNWLSLYNNTHDILRFELTADSKQSLLDASQLSYYGEFNGIRGFEIDLNGNDLTHSSDAIIFPDDSGDTDSDSVYYLIFYVYTFDREDDDPILVTMERNSSNSNELMLNKNETELLSGLVNGFVGEYFTELGIKLGSKNYSGIEYASLEFVYQYSLLFYKMALANGTSNWDFSMLDEAIELTNGIVSGNNATSTSVDSSSTDSMTTSSDSVQFFEGSQRKLLSCTLSDTCGNPCYGMCGDECSCWWWICWGCGCYDGCQQHDYYCSCVSFWSWGCLNIFSFSCDGYR